MCNGFLAENDWGTWNQFTERDSAAMHRIFTMLRFFGKRGLLTSPDWVPHVAGVKHNGVYASVFPQHGEFLYMLVNRGANSTSGPQLQLPKAAVEGSGSPIIVYDCWRGEILHPSADRVLSFDMDVEGYGTVAHPMNAIVHSLCSSEWARN